MSRMRYNTTIECWNILKYEIESITDQFVPLKKNKENSIGKKHLAKETVRKIPYKQTMWRVYRNDDEYTNYKEVHNAARMKLDNLKEAMSKNCM